MAFSLHHQTLRRFAQDSQILQFLDDSGLLRLTKIGIHEHVPAGTIILSEGAVGYDLYLLAAGEVRILKSDVPGQEIARLKPGAIFGEMAAISQEPRSATVQTTVNSQVVRFPFNGVVSIFKDYPQIHSFLGNISAERTQANLALPVSRSTPNNNADPDVAHFLISGTELPHAGSFEQTTPPATQIPPSLRAKNKREP